MRKFIRNLIRKISERPVIINTGKSRDYYEIRYYDYEDNNFHIGYGSYNKEFVKQWKKDLVEVWRKENKH